MKKPHKHAEAIKGWADGETIQYFDINETQWLDVIGNPRWDLKCQYRIKPKPEYPTTLMGEVEFEAAFDLPYSLNLANCAKLANAAIRHAIDSGQVIIAPKGE